MSGRQSFTKRVLIPLAVIISTVLLLAFAGLKLMSLKPSSSSPVVMATESGKPVETLSVLVLNGTNKSGLARTTADEIAKKGWVIRTVGNYTGPKLKKTTVFYPSEYKGIAENLASDTGAAIAPAQSTMPTRALTLVVVR
jgi:hypothetical protein